jgi:hypothetical protein
MLHRLLFLPARLPLFPLTVNLRQTMRHRRENAEASENDSGSTSYLMTVAVISEQELSDERRQRFPVILLTQLRL